MREFAHYLIFDDKCFSSRIDCWSFRQEEKHALDPFQFRARFSRGHAEADDMEFFTLLRQKPDGSISGNIERMVRL